MDELERELLRIVTRELGEVRIMACKSKLGSDRHGELGRGRFLLGRFVNLGLGNRELSIACRYSMCRALLAAPVVDATEGMMSA